MKDIDYRTLHVVLGTPSIEREDAQDGATLYAWSCGCEAVHHPSKVYCDIRCCDEHRPVFNSPSLT